MLSGIKPVTKIQIILYAQEAPGIVKFIGRESRMADARACGQSGELFLFRTEFNMKSSGDWLHNNMAVLNRNELCT